ncbi:MAG: AI-2E family transporter, partial [Gemmatimonadales bacterium]
MKTLDTTTPLFRLVVLGAGLVIIAAGLKASASVVNLVLLSLLLATTLSPVPIILTKRGLGQGAAIGLTVLVSVAGGVALLMVLAKSVSRLSENLPQYQASLAGLLDGLEAKLAARGMALDEALKPDPARFMARVGGLLRASLGLVGTGLLSLVLIVLFLIELPLL